MPKVYKIVPDEDCQYLEPADFDAYRKASKTTWRFGGHRVAGKWDPLEVYSREPTLILPDIWGLLQTFAFEDRAAAKVRKFLDQSCQEFKLPFGGRNLVVANVVYVLDCLDVEKSKFDEDIPEIVDQFAFHVDRIDYPLFKIPQTMHHDILTIEGISSPDDEFKATIEKHGLKGLKFVELWSNDE